MRRQKHCNIAYFISTNYGSARFARFADAFYIIVHFLYRSMQNKKVNLKSSNEIFTDRKLACMHARIILIAEYEYN